MSRNSHAATCHQVQIEYRGPFYSWAFFPSGQIDHLTINSNHTARWLLIISEIPVTSPDEEKITAPCWRGPFLRGSIPLLSFPLLPLFLARLFCFFSNIFVPGGDGELNSPLFSSSYRRNAAPVRNRAGCRVFGPEMSESEKTCLSPGPKCRRTLCRMSNWIKRRRQYVTTLGYGESEKEELPTVLCVPPYR